MKTRALKILINKLLKIVKKNISNIEWRGTYFVKIFPPSTYKHRKECQESKENPPTKNLIWYPSFVYFQMPQVHNLQNICWDNQGSYSNAPTHCHDCEIYFCRVCISAPSYIFFTVAVTELDQLINIKKIPYEFYSRANIRDLKDIDQTHYINEAE